jgi:glycosyltransferase involved in cell wall biosynthesis
VDDARTLISSTRRPGDPPLAEAGLSVAYYSPSWPPGTESNGVVTYVGTITQGMQRMGNVATVMTHQVARDAPPDGIYHLGAGGERLTLPGRLLDRLEFRVRPARAFDRTTCRSIVAATRRAIDERGVQLLEMEESFGWPYRLRKKLPIPIIVRLHGPWFLNGPADGKPDDAILRQRVRQEGLAIRAADGITAPSRDVLERTRSHYGLDLEGAEVIPNPVPDIPVSERWIPASSESREILFIGRFDLHKGGDTIIDAFAGVAGRIPRARLRFVGQDRGIVDRGGRRWAVRDYIEDRLPGALERGQVEYLGQRPHATLPGLRRCAAVTVVCSRYETFGITATEAMSQGCPLVVTEAGALPEIVEDGVNGLVCRSDDPGELAEKLCSILDNPSYAARLGHQAEIDSRRRYDSDLIAAQSADYYQRVIARARTQQQTRSTAK